LHAFTHPSTFRRAGDLRHGSTSQDKEVDDVIRTLENVTPAIGLSSVVAVEHSAHTAPDASFQGTPVPCGQTWTDVAPLAVQVAFGARVPSLPGVRPRGAPV
jgi:hypothetical protein